MGLPLSKASGDPSDGKTEAKLNRKGDTISVDNPDRIGSEGNLGAEVERSQDSGSFQDFIASWTGKEQEFWVPNCLGVWGFRFYT